MRGLPAQARFTKKKSVYMSRLLHLVRGWPVARDGRSCSWACRHYVLSLLPRPLDPLNNVCVVGPSLGL